MKKKPTGNLGAVSHNTDIDGKAHYDKWSTSYDDDLVNEYGYVAPGQILDGLDSLNLEKHSRIIDLGCGTGLVGVELEKRGYTNFDGADFSQGMLEKARGLDVYRKLFCLDLTQPTTLSANSFDAAIAAGLFGAGHLHARHIREFIRIVKPGGHIVILMNALPFEEDNYEKEFETIVSEGNWQISSITALNYMSELERPGKLILSEVL